MNVALLGLYLIYEIWPSSGLVVVMFERSVDVKFWRLKMIPALKELKYLLWSKTYNIGIQMMQKELTKTFMMFSNWKKPFSLHGLDKNNSGLYKG